jgi:catechol 2,3-dioxygenase-like lactoylglutathione lyase family enzyme
MHLSFATRDLVASVAFYRTLLFAEPAKHHPNYALFLTEQPGLELALDLDLDSTANANGRESAHYGVVVEKPEEVDAATARLRGAGYAVDVETEATCCYAVQNKVWATDPDGRRWETYYVLEETAERDNGATTCCATEDALAAPASSCCSNDD